VFAKLDGLTVEQVPEALTIADPATATAGDVVTLTTSPKDATKHVFEKWDTDGTVGQVMPEDGGSWTSPSVKVKIPATGLVIKPIYAPLYRAAIHQATGGAAYLHKADTSQKTTDEQYVRQDRNVTLIAEPASGYRFVRWDVPASVTAWTAGSSTSERAAFAMPAEPAGVAVTPVFTAVTLTTNVTGGRANADPQDAVIGQDVRFEATATDATWRFDHWQMNKGAEIKAGGKHDPNITAVVPDDGDFAIEPVFVKLNPVTVVQGASGTAAASNAQMPGADPITAAAGDDVTLTLTDVASQYRFTGWSGVPDGQWVTGDASSKTATFRMGAGPVTVKPLFDHLAGLRLTGTVKGGTATATPDTAAVGDTVILTATPTGTNQYRFSEWDTSGTTGAPHWTGGDAKSAIASVKIPQGGLTVKPVFVQLRPVDIASTSGGTATPSGTSYAAARDTVTVSAEADPGYRFVKWEATGLAAAPSGKTASFTMPSVAVSLKAVFVALKALRLTESVTGGTATANPTPAEVAVGDTVALTATPSDPDSYRFSHWDTTGTTGVPQWTGGDATSAAATVKIPEGGLTVKPVFVQLHAVEAADTLGGTAKVSIPASRDARSGSLRAAAGTPVTIKASVEDGYVFTGWDLGTDDVEWLFGSAAEARSQFAMLDRDVTATARFAKVHEVTLHQGVGGTATAGRTSGIKGDTVALAATPADGYVFDRWIVTPDDVRWTSDSAMNQSATFALPDEDVTVTPVFTVKPVETHRVEFSAGKGKLAPAEVQRDVQFGSAVGTLPVPKRAKHVFLGWTASPKGGRVATGAMVPTGDVTLHAVWAKKGKASAWKGTSVKVLKAPKANAKVVGKVKTRAKLMVLAHKKGWLKVRTVAGKTGWVLPAKIKKQA
jgi:hypothetical protein